MKTFLLCLLLFLGADYIQAQTLIRGPYLQVATSTSMNVKWRTDIKTGSRVRYGLSQGNLNMTAEDLASDTTEHEIKIIGLTPATKYWYSVETGSAVLQGNGDNFFYTLPVPGSKSLYRIAAIGDCGNASPNQVNVRDALLNYLGSDYMTAWILLGDNAYPNGTDGQYSTGFFNMYKDRFLKQNPLFPTPGNHDYSSSTAARVENRPNVPYHKIFSVPINGEAGGTPSGNKAFYSFDIGNVHFLSLDSYGREIGLTRLSDTLGPQVTWIKQDLENNSNKDWIVAYFHHPPYTMGSHNSDSETELVNIRSNFIRILERYGVDLIICGHSHVYERSRLMKGHYELEASFNPSEHNISQSNGMYNGTESSCPYIKKTATGNEGTIYVVAGSAGQLGGSVGGFPHEAMFYSNKDVGGSLMLEVQGNRMDVKWICSDGVIRDRFTMLKETGNNATHNIEVGQNVELTASYPGTYNWSTGATTRSITVTPLVPGSMQYTVKDNQECITDTFSVVASAVLPVTWGNIKCRYDRSLDANLLQWEVLAQQNNRQFTIERSLNAARFDVIGRIDLPDDHPAGAQTYSYTDKKIEAGKKYYYRIKQTDADGRFSYSPVIIPDHPASRDFEVQIIPNPASANEIRIRLSAGAPRLVTLLLTDSKGKTVSKTAFQLDSKLRSFMPMVSAGVYYLSVIAPGYITSRQIVIQ
ncbi:MAG: metallophosphoesterase [Chitinophagaceae bacterium]|nr:metallophosphoesterase [Chitinophagaceae bacterium]